MLTPEELRERVRAFLAEHDPHEMPKQDFNNARFDAGLAWVHYPEGLGGLGLSRSLQQLVDVEFAAVGAPGHDAERIPVRRIGQPNDVAHTISFLVSEGASFVSGQVIYVAGGPLC